MYCITQIKPIGKKWAWRRSLWKWVVDSAKQNASLKQGVQVSMATTTRRHPTETLSEDKLANLYNQLDQRREGGKLLHKATIRSSKEVHDLRDWVHIIWRLAKLVWIGAVILSRRGPALAQF